MSNRQVIDKNPYRLLKSRVGNSQRDNKKNTDILSVFFYFYIFTCHPDKETFAKDLYGSISTGTSE